MRSVFTWIAILFFVASGRHIVPPNVPSSLLTALFSSLGWITNTKLSFLVCILLYSHTINMLIYICIYMQNESQRHNDKGRAKTSLENMYLSLNCKGSKGLFKVLWREGVGDRTELQYIDPHSYGHQRCVFLVLQGCSTGGPGAQLSAEWWLSLLHLISNFSGPLLNRGSRAPSAWCGLPKHIPSLLQLSDFLSWPSYIIVQRPLNRPLNLWNGMFDRHQADITVMQFRGDSLPVYLSMSVPWDFLPCPISSAKHAYAISSHNCHWNVSLPSSASLWNGKFGRVEGQNTTIQNFIHLIHFTDLIRGSGEPDHRRKITSYHFHWSQLTNLKLRSNF